LLLFYMKWNKEMPKEVLLPCALAAEWAHLYWFKDNNSVCHS